EGRRDNIHKARIKVLLKTLGPEKFRELVEAEWQAARESAPRYDEAEIVRITQLFSPPAYESLADEDVVSGKADKFRRWYQQNTRRHKMSGYRVVYISLKHPARPPGDVTDEQMDRIADLA